MILLGLLCMILGFVFGISLLWVLGIILLIVGVILAVVGAAGHAVGGRSHWY